MRRVLVTVLACAVVLGIGNAAEAKKVPCKKIKEAIASGKTTEQVASELGTRVQRVEACMARKKNKAAAAAAGAAPSGEADEE